MNNYFACMGGGPILTGTPTTNDACYRPNVVGGSLAQFKNGLMGVGTKRGIRDATDGTTNVVLAGESIYGGMEVLRGWFHGIRTNSGSNNPPASLAGTAGAPNGGKAHYLAFTTGVSGQNIHNAVLTLFFGSMHVGGCHFLMADGSVHFISENINLQLYQRLGVMNDGEPVGGFTP